MRTFFTAVGISVASIYCGSIFAACVSFNVLDSLNFSTLILLRPPFGPRPVAYHMPYFGFVFEIPDLS